MKKLGFFAVFLTLTACASDDSEDPKRFRNLNNAGTSTAYLMPQGMTVEDMYRVGRNFCAGKEQCILRGWEKEEDIPPDNNLTTQHYKSSLFVYRGLPDKEIKETLITDCKRYPRDNPHQCFN